MGAMFNGASAFNQDISGWNTANVTDMQNMFAGASKFNQDISSWDTRQVQIMVGMFANASSFDQDLSDWQVANVYNADFMFLNVTLSTPNYDALLISWAGQSLRDNVSFHGGESRYCNAEEARSYIIATNDWSISDGGKYCPTQPSDHFVIVVRTDNPGFSDDNQFTIPTHSSVVYDYNVDCDDDGIDESIGLTGDFTCTYPDSGVYRIRIKDNNGDGTGFPRIYFLDGIVTIPDKQKLIAIEQWGTLKWTSMENAFYGCSNLAGSPTDVPDLSNVTSLSSMFSGASKFNGDIRGWNTSQVMDMSGMFRGATQFNQDLSLWDTSQVTDMSWMFYEAEYFNQDIGSWDTGNVLDMSRMFAVASSFNQDLSGWDTGMVTNMNGMFSHASAFNQDIGGWHTGNVTEMRSMFFNAAAFDQDLGGWNVESLTKADSMFKDVALSTGNYDALLMGWAAQDLQLGVSFGGGNSTYCEGEGARNVLQESHYWTISDGGKGCSSAFSLFLPMIVSD
jgi:surface protein